MGPRRSTDSSLDIGVRTQSGEHHGTRTSRETPHPLSDPPWSYGVSDVQEHTSVDRSDLVPPKVPKVLHFCVPAVVPEGFSRTGGSGSTSPSPTHDIFTEPDFHCPLPIRNTEPDRTNLEKVPLQPDPYLPDGK